MSILFLIFSFSERARKFRGKIALSLEKIIFDVELDGNVSFIGATIVHFILYNHSIFFTASALSRGLFVEIGFYLLLFPFILSIYVVEILLFLTTLLRST